MSKKEDLEKRKKIEALKKRQAAAITSGVIKANDLGEATAKRDASIERQNVKRGLDNIGVGTFTEKSQYDNKSPKITNNDKAYSSKSNSSLSKEETVEAMKKGISIYNKRKKK
jgi:hypothetical protein